VRWRTAPAWVRTPTGSELVIDRVMVPRRAAALFLGVRTLLDFQPAAEICQNSRLPLHFAEADPPMLPAIWRASSSV